MNDSRQLDLLKRLTFHLQGITPENGYSFDMSEGVFRGRTIYGDDAPLTMLSIVEHLTADVAVELAGENNVNRQETWVLLVQGWLENTPENPTDDAYQLKAEVEKRLSELIKMKPSGDPMYPDVYKLGVKNLITGIAIGPGVVSSGVRVEGGSVKSFFYLPVGITLAVDVSDPFVDNNFEP